jgi:hypothetical protein
MSADKSIHHLPVTMAPPVALQSPNQIPALRRARAGLITDWHRGLLASVYIRQSTPRMLHHPIYAGAYSYGRRRVDHKRAASTAAGLNRNPSSARAASGDNPAVSD